MSEIMKADMVQSQISDGFFEMLINRYMSEVPTCLIGKYKIIRVVPSESC